MALQNQLIKLDRVPFEKWPENGLKLGAVSANADGIVNSGITKAGVYFYRKWSSNFKTSQLVVG